MNGELAHQINVGLLDHLSSSPRSPSKSLNLISWNQLWECKCEAELKYDYSVLQAQELWWEEKEAQGNHSCDQEWGAQIALFGSVLDSLGVLRKICF